MNLPMPLQCQALGHRFDNQIVLSNLDFSVPAGQVTALLGRNGAGKTTLIRCALGQLAPTEGRVSLFGEPSLHARSRAMQRVGVVPEHPQVPPEWTVRQTFSFAQTLHTRWDEGASLRSLQEAGIPLDQSFGTLSRGQKAQVSLALALAKRPDLLILDDPTLGLDAVARQSLYRRVVEELADHGTTVFMTTHDLAGVESLADRVAILQGHRLVLDAPLEAIKTSGRVLHAASIERLQAANLPLHPGSVKPSAFGATALCLGWQESELPEGITAEPLRLETLFTALTTAEEVHS